MGEQETDATSLPATGDGNRLSTVVLDPATIPRRDSNIEHEREVAIFDLVDANSFALTSGAAGPYQLRIAIADDRLMLALNPAAGMPAALRLNPTPFRAVIRDYGVICESYFEAVRRAPPSRIAAIDDERRAVHDHGARLLQSQLSPDVTMDAATARRLFTLVASVLRR